MTGWQIAFETSCRQGNIALLRHDVTVKQIVLPTELRTAQTLAPAVEELMGVLSKSQGRLQFVSVSQGPGSFTGLRIGVTAAKTLAFAFGIPVVACDTLQAMILAVRETLPHVAVIDAVLNAYRGQVFWRRETHDGSVLFPSQAIEIEDWIGSFLGEKITAVGDVWGKRPILPTGVELAASQLWEPSATAVGQLGWEMFRQGLAQDPMTLVPNYLRESAASEKRKQETKP